MHTGSFFSLADRFQDPRFVEFTRLVYFERPDLSAERTSEQMNDWLGDRFLTDDGSVSWTTLPKAFA